MTFQEEANADYRIEAPVHFVRCGNKIIGLPPRLETPEIVRLLKAVNNWGILTPDEASLLLWLFNQPDLFNML